MTIIKSNFHDKRTWVLARIKERPDGLSRVELGILAGVNPESKRGRVSQWAVRMCQSLERDGLIHQIGTRSHRSRSGSNESTVYRAGPAPAGHAIVERQTTVEAIMAPWVEAARKWLESGGGYGETT